MKSPVENDTGNQKAQGGHLSRHLISHAEQGNGTFFHELLTEEELIAFLRIPQISKSKDYHNVVEHLKRLRSLPRIRICNKTLYPKKAILHWIDRETTNGK